MNPSRVTGSKDAKVSSIIIASIAGAHVAKTGKRAERGFRTLQRPMYR